LRRFGGAALLPRSGGTLNAEQCARLWRMTDRQGVPPSEELADMVDGWFDSRRIDERDSAP